MPNKLRRFEVLLPVRLNDGTEVPEELLADAVNEIVRQFGAASFHREPIEGHWRHGSQIYRDNLTLLVVDLPDLAVNRKWMKQLSNRHRMNERRGKRAERLHRSALFVHTPPAGFTSFIPRLETTTRRSTGRTRTDADAAGRRRSPWCVCS
jgi:hypothetical protein